MRHMFMKAASSVKRHITAFAHNESGVTLPMLAMAMMVITGFIGTAVDVARLQLVQSRLSFALDAAGLAAGSTMSTSNLNTELTKYMAANYPADYLGSTAPQISSQVSTDNMIIDLVATTTMPTTFMALFGQDEMSVSATSQITRTASGLELVMALDTTGSMNSSGKLTALKSAATSLVNILYGAKTTVPNLWIGLVPFSQTVNVGTGRLNTWINKTHYSTLNWGPTSWQGCVDARETSSGDVNDDPPTVQKYKVYFSPSTDNRAAPYNVSPYTDANRWVKTRDGSGNPLTYNTIDSDTSPNAYCPQVMTPMTANKTTILNGISALVAQGNTHIGLGAVWAWNMLSPRWKGQWGGEMDSSGLPLDYGTKHMNKAMILLTDGDNTMSQQIYTAYGYLSDGRLGSTTSSSTAENKLDAKLTTVCTAMKNKGIYVYTIALGSLSSSTKTLMKGCASASNYYFESPTASQLNGVFNAIADSLSNLRVSE